MTNTPTGETVTAEERVAMYACTVKVGDSEMYVIAAYTAARIAEEHAAAATARAEKLAALLREAEDFDVFDCNAGMDRYDGWLERIAAALAPAQETQP